MADLDVGRIFAAPYISHFWDDLGRSTLKMISKTCGFHFCGRISDYIFMAVRLAPTLALRHSAAGCNMPLVGVGTWQVKDPDNLHSILDEAFRVGYRFIDTAIAYDNEDAIGKSLKTLLPAHNLQRSDIFITSKLPPSCQGSGKAKEAILQSLKRLQLDYIDLYLIHWPGSGKLKPEDEMNAELRLQSWRHMEELHAAGLVRAIGVSNYAAGHMRELSKVAKVLPAVNQCEFHPYYMDIDSMRACKDMGCHYQAYSSLGGPASDGAVLRDPVVVNLAAKHNCSAANILLAFGLAHGCSVLPRTTKVRRVAENFECLNVKLSEDDVKSLDALAKSGNAVKYAWDPKTVK